MSVLFDTDGGGSRYEIANSLRLRSSASAYLSRTMVAPTDNKTWTWSGWVKRGNLSSATNQSLFGAYLELPNYGLIQIRTTDDLDVQVQVSGVMVIRKITSQILRDPAAHYHIVVALDTSNATSTDRCRIYINGARVTSFSTSTDPSINQTTRINSAALHEVGSLNTGSLFDGYLSNIHFIDGQALDASYFGQQDNNGVWVPKGYSGTYGTNGFYLPFNEGTSTTTLGYDRSGNSNNWTLNNVSLTAGATYDWMTDTPTNNYCTFNALAKAAASACTDGNLVGDTSTAATERIASTIGVSSGKWYFEFVPTAISSGGCMVGISDATRSDTNLFVGASGVTGYGYYTTGNKYTPSGASAYGATFTTNDVIGVALDCDGSTVTFYKNNSSQGSIAITSGLTWCPAISNGGAGSDCTVRLFNGANGFTYTPPTGFKALCTANLPAVTIAKPKLHFDVAIYTTTGSAQTITTDGNGNNLLLTPDFLWNKGRNLVQNNYLADNVRGITNTLISDLPSAESSTSVFTATGAGSFTTGGEPASRTKVVWLWKANGAGSSNTSGTITSTVSANTTAGFSIVSYTGNGTNGATVGHGLGITPKMFIIKRRDGSFSWGIYHASVGATQVLAFDTAAAITDSTSFNNTAPTSSVFSLGTANAINANTQTYIAYCFAEVAGFSKFGSYTGNGSTDGPYIHLGFRPRYIIVKATTAIAGNWVIHDTARDSYNATDDVLYANLSNLEATIAIDVTANGFKIRNNTTNMNNSGSDTYIFAAFAEFPFGGQGVSPAPAR